MDLSLAELLRLKKAKEAGEPSRSPAMVESETDDPEVAYKNLERALQMMDQQDYGQVDGPEVPVDAKYKALQKILQRK